MIGIFGGTFDPVHFGHLRPALEVLERMALDQIRFIPARQPPHRDQPLASAEHRLAMLKLALADQPGFVMDDRELRRSGPSYMIDTLHSLREDYGVDRPFCLILGLDAFSGLESWHRWQEILDATHIVIAQRPLADQRVGLSPGLQALLDQRRVRQLSELETRPAGHLYQVEVTQLAISATAIRDYCRQDKSCRFLLPDTVYEYIQRSGLYKF